MLAACCGLVLRRYAKRRRLLPLLSVLGLSRIVFRRSLAFFDSGLLNRRSSIELPLLFEKRWQTLSPLPAPSLYLYGLPKTNGKVCTARFASTPNTNKMHHIYRNQYRTQDSYQLTSETKKIVQPTSAPTIVPFIRIY
jgi:hypothetical protein